MMSNRISLSLGPPCDLDRNYWGEFECHYSCPLCNPAHSCDWSSCYDDLGFLEFLIDLIGQDYCLDLNQIHLSGISNGGMLAYFVMATATDGIGKKNQMDLDNKSPKMG